MPIKLLDDHKLNFDGLFTFEMANNHQGDVEHGKRIIREIAAGVRQAGVRGAIKLQFRDLDTFVHPDYRQNTDNKHIQRFLSTRLSSEQFAELVSEIRAQGMLTMCTPFDEPSVDLLERLEIDILKIGSCSAKDWPLLERAAKSRKPIIVSTGGLSMKDVDNLVSFLDHRYAHYAIMHCVAIYPTPMEKLQLNHIERLRQRYPQATIGFSTHEDPNNFDAIKMAYAKGARVFERHVGVPTDTITLNAYSSTPQQIAYWLAAYREAVAAMGPDDARVIESEESRDLLTLQRGIFAKRSIKAGEEIARDDVFFAFPIQSGQLSSGRWRSGLIADRDYPANAAIADAILSPVPSKREIIYQAIHEMKGMLNDAKIALSTEFSMELSHHYGIERFQEVGTTIIDCINREYCKKILIQLPGQQHPYHHHRKKEESFQVLSGELYVELEGRRRVLYSGDIL
ncbi:MAG: N-acetylneuraminate synthase family protein, partial [Candidatus Uhrbacteria bacterium]|nr:N-acetylneuraminate synthase family protein [Candidatus Uhrbacteria bacterium]